jgi:hypothetical protein
VQYLKYSYDEGTGKAIYFGRRSEPGGRNGACIARPADCFPTTQLKSSKAHTLWPVPTAGSAGSDGSLLDVGQCAV